MVKAIKQIILLSLIVYTLSAKADDTDIYLKSGAVSTPPYLMLMLDYRPSVFSSFCNGFGACVPKMTAASFGKLCAEHGFPAVTTPALTQANKEAICRKWFQDFQADDAADYQF